jgi:hypothetical protein
VGHRVATWTIVIWTGLMALAIFGASLGIGGDCVGLAGSELSTCQADALARGAVGLGLLVFLWFVVFAPLAIWWSLSRPKAGAPGASVP